MIKGGFQGLDISGVDLTAQSPTLSGGYAACQAADGKTVLVLTAAGAVQCSIKKVSTNYVLAGITGDGKILSITIGSTDGISVSETEIPSGVEAEVYLDTEVSIKTATSEAPFTAPFDGIIRLNKKSSSTLIVPPAIVVKAGATSPVGKNILTVAADAATGTYASCFVKKGTIIYCTGVDTGVAADFLSYKPVES